MKLKIYVGRYETLQTPTLMNTVRYKLEGTGNPANTTRLGIDFNLNGASFMNIDKTFGSTSSLTSSIRGTNSNVTMANLLTNLQTYNNVSIPTITYSLSTASNIYGYKDIYADVDIEATDVESINGYWNNTSAIQFVAPYVIATYSVSATQSSYVYDLDLDLYKDENIQFTAKLGDLEKLSNVFTDFSNSFTVPATPKNNEVFKHYYDIDFDNNYTFNANIRIPCYIEIDSYTFRWGKIQLEKVELKKKRPDNYKITFYGGLKQLSDLFADDTIDKLDYIKDTFGVYQKTWNMLSQYDFPYSEENLKRSLQDASFMNGEIITPLIAYTDRDWNYGSNNSIDISLPGSDVSGNISAINDTELRQAIRVMNILKAIENKYGISFSRHFFGKAVFNNLFMWMNNRADKILGVSRDTPITPPFSGAGQTWQGPSGMNEDHGYGTMMVIDNFIDIYHRRYTNYGANHYRTWVDWHIYPSTPSGVYDAVIVDENGGEVQRQNGLTGYQLITIYWEADFCMYCDENELLHDKIKLQIIPHESMTVQVQVYLHQERQSASMMDISTSMSSSLSPAVSMPVDVIVEDNIPKMKVIDFIQGIMKMFKLVIRPITKTSFYMNTLDGFYSEGKILNVSNYIDNEAITIERPLIYSKIIFTYAKTENVLGKKFRIMNDPVDDLVGYGDLRVEYKSIETKDELKVELPFENMMFERLQVQQPSPSAGQFTKINIGQAISTSDYKTFSKNKCKPILFFNNGIVDNSIFPYQFSFNGSITSMTHSFLISNTNDELITQVSDTINWGSENDQWHQLRVDNSLYLNYWSNWINTIYSLKQRKFAFSGNLPPRYIEELSLNDRLIIGDERYKINDYSIDLVTGDTKLNLFKDIYNYDNVSYNKDIYNSQFIADSYGLYITDFTTANSSGSYYMIGGFTAFNGETANRLVKIKSNGKMDHSFNSGSGLNSFQYAFASILKFPDDSILVTGNFTNYNGIARNRIVKIKPNGTVDTTFAYTSGSNNYMMGSCFSGTSSIFLSGGFTNYNGVSVPKFAKISLDGTLDTTFNTNLGVGFNNITSDVVENNDGTLYVTGYFSSFQGVSSNKIAKIGPTGLIAGSFSCGTGFNNTGTTPNGLIKSDDNGVYVYGYFTSYNGTSANRIIKLKEDGSIDTSFIYGTGFNGNVGIGRKMNDGRLFFTGPFTSYNGISSKGAIILNQDGSPYITYDDTSLVQNESMAYFVDNDLYTTKNGYLYRISDSNKINFNYDSITSNAGKKYYGISIFTDLPYTLSKLDTGDGTIWATILTPNDNESGEALFYLDYNTSTTRFMSLKVSSGIFSKFIRVRQNSL